LAYRLEGQTRSKCLVYTDLALETVIDEDLDKLVLFAESAGGGAALSKRRGEDIARARVAAAHNQRLAAADWPALAGQ
jgi:hypothetical protein